MAKAIIIKKCWALKKQNPKLACKVSVITSGRQDTDCQWLGNAYKLLTRKVPFTCKLNLFHTGVRREQ